RIPGGHRVPPARGFALMAGVAVALVPGLVLASSAQATPRHQASARAALPHVTRTQSRDSGSAVHHDRSLPLRVTAARAHAHPAPPPRRRAAGGGWRRPRPPASHRPDPVAQSRPGTRAAVATTSNFDGISVSSAGNRCGCAPPDPNGAVGTTQVVELVNDA